ncbi:MAG: thioredoxin family protein [Spirochaetia bacterium]
MAQTPSTMLQLGTQMPGFSLPSTDGTTFSSEQLAGRPTVVVFMCNHCPFVIHVIDVLAERARDYAKLGVAVVGINANDVTTHESDSPEHMKEFVAEHSVEFPYLYDETQETTKAFKAACTPDVYLFDKYHKLVYRGQFDAARPSLDTPVTGEDLTAAVQAVVEERSVAEKQIPSIGCNIKWKAGNAPDYTVV